MHAIMGLLVLGFFGFVFYFILYLFIGWAIDHSKMAKNIEIIKDILAKKHLLQEETEEEAHEFNITQTPINECPACHGKVELDDKLCSSCGLKFIISKD